jgi:outer membrane protein
MRFFLLLSLALAAAAPAQEEKLSQSESWQSRARRGEVLELTLKATLELALTGNLEVTIEKYSVDQVARQLDAAQGYYDPVVGFNVGLNSSDSPATSVLQGGLASENNRAATFQPSLQQNLPAGGTFQLLFNNFRNTTSNAYTFVNPLFGSSFDVNYVQPLWRGFRQNAADRQIRLIRLENRISESQFHLRLADIIEQVRNQYWNLVGAIDQYEVRRASQALAIRQYENTRQRAQNGLLTPVAVTSARAEVALCEQQVLQAELAINSAENGLKQLLAPDPKSQLWRISLIPLDRPGLQTVSITLDDAIRTALDRRQELKQLQFQSMQNDVDRGYFSNGTKPRVDLSTNFGSIGRAGTVFIPTVIGGSDTRVVDPSHPGYGGLRTAWGQVFGLDFLHWGASLTMELPLRNRTAEAELAQAKIKQKQLESRTKLVQQAIMVEVRNAYDAIQTQRKAVEVARIGSQLATEQLAGESERFEAGFSTNFEILRYQRDLAEARIRELSTLIAYQGATTALERAMDIIVDKSDVSVARRSREGSREVH